jgi:hypothetical protein
MTHSRQDLGAYRGWRHGATWQPCKVVSFSEIRVPGAVRPEETEDLAVADLEGDLLERDPVTEALAQVMHGQRRSAPLPPDGASLSELTKRSLRGSTAGSCRADAATGASAGNAVRRLSLLVSHLIR